MRQGVITVFWQTGIIHPGDFGVVGEILSDGKRIVAMALNAEWQRFYPRQKEE